MSRNAQRVKSAMIALTGGIVFLRFYQKMSGLVYFYFKVLISLWKNMSRIFRIALLIVSLHARKLAQHFDCAIS